MDPRAPINDPDANLTLEEYNLMYSESVKDPNSFWKKDYTKISSGSLEAGNIKWFEDGKLNASINCVDRHAARDPSKVAIIWEGDDPSVCRKITYGELSLMVQKFANVLKSLGLSQGDTVTIYMPMVPEAAVAMLSCARLGVIHNKEALAERITDSNSKVVVTADGGIRGGKKSCLKEIVDEALHDSKVEKVIVYKHNQLDVSMIEGRDFWWHDVMDAASNRCEATAVDSESPLFYLYTSGSTGKPKGIAHSTAGYLLYASITLKYVFDVRKNDIFGCLADIGWITGHSYIVYGPLCLGLTTTMFEGTPICPDASRYWQLVQTHKITQLYTAPTVIRLLEKFGTKPIEGYDLSSLRVLGTVGEPINEQAWNWYFENIGKSKCPVVDTYWQTETGGILLTSLPFCHPTKAGAAGFPFFGISPVILDQDTGKELSGPNVTGILAIKNAWPSVCRTIFGDHTRYMNAYLKPYPSYYYTADSAHRDKDNFIWIRGRVDDVINVSGHRLSTSEIEGVVTRHPACVEVAALGEHDDLTGQAICVFCILRSDVTTTHSILRQEIISLVRETIGPIAKPKRIIFTHDLPKTRSGKIMRRLLRKILDNKENEMGDLSTLSNPSVNEFLIKAVRESRQ